MEFQKLSIFHRLLLLIAGTSLLVALISGIFHYVFASRLIASSVRSQMQTALQTSLAYFDRTYVVPIAANLRVLESSPSVDKLLMSFDAEAYVNRPEVERLFLSVANPQASLYSSIRLISADGQERIIVSEGKRIRKYRSVLESVRPNDFEEEIATLYAGLSKSKPGRILLEGPIANQDGSFSFLIGISKREPDIGGFGGAVVAEVNLADYLTYLSNFQIFEKSMTWVFDQAGNRILTPPLNEVELDPEVYLFGQEPIPKGVLLYASRPGHKSTDERTIAGVSDLFRIAFVMSSRQYSSQMQGAGMITALVVSATVLFATVIAFLAAKQLSSPIRALSQMTTSVAGGDLDTRVSEAWSGELGQLAVAFNHMVHTLRETTFSKSYVDNIIRSMSDTLVVVDEHAMIVKANRALLDLLGYEERELQGEPVTKLLKDVSVEQEIVQALDKNRFLRGMETVYLAKDGKEIPVSLSSSVMRASDGRLTGFVCVAQDITERRILETQLRQAQKLESIGQLAAGIAHEINTPTQFVSDNTRFLIDAFGDLLTYLKKTAGLIEVAQNETVSPQIIEETRAAMEEADMDYLSEEIPRALEDSMEGLERVTKIVRAMKEFSHPTVEKGATDINRAIESTITVAKNEWKYVADVVTDFDPSLPLVPCLKGEFNQVILNILVNAAHAIADVTGSGSDDKGTITVRTRHDDQWVETRITDTGPGIPEEIKMKVFDHFFTTKEVGKGTGQGLSIAHNVVVNKHGGTISVDSAVGQGACFVVRLPIHEPNAVAEAATA